MSNSNQIIEPIKDSFEEYKNKFNFNLEMIKHLKDGKEASIYLVYEKNSNINLALKLYKDNQNYSYNLYKPYLENVRINPKFKKLATTKTYRGKKYMAQLRTLREFKVMQRNYHQNLNYMAGIPKTYGCSQNSILMDFIGQNQTPAPRLSSFKLNIEEAKKYSTKILKLINYFYQNQIIHADLSAFNILVDKNLLWVIDFPQAVDIKVNPNWKSFLKRDLSNLAKYFDKSIDLTKDNLYQKLIDLTN